MLTRQPWFEPDDDDDGGWSRLDPRLGKSNHAIGSSFGKDVVTAWFVFHVDSAIVLHRFYNQFIAYLGKVSGQTILCW